MPQFPSTFTDVFSPDTLVAGQTQTVTESQTLLSGQVLARGTLVGRITTGGKMTLSLLASADGSQIPYGILADSYNATAGDLAGCGVMVKGEFDQNAVIFGTGQTVANTHDALRDAGIYLKPSLPNV
jgi:hypothetical protein